jgi:hypothetical protein
MSLVRYSRPVRYSMEGDYANWSGPGPFTERHLAHAERYLRELQAVTWQEAWARAERYARSEAPALARYAAATRPGGGDAGGGEFVTRLPDSAFGESQPTPNAGDDFTEAHLNAARAAQADALMSWSCISPFQVPQHGLRAIAHFAGDAAHFANVPDRQRLRHQVSVRVPQGVDEHVVLHVMQEAA